MNDRPIFRAQTCLPLAGVWGALLLLIAAVAFALFAASTARAEITYPVDVDATAGRWTIWDTQTGQPLLQHRNWPVADGGPVPGLDPRYAYLLEVRDEPPEIDTRLWVIEYPCPTVADVAGNTLTTTCDAELRPGDELKGAVKNVANERINEAIEMYGFTDPGDYARALALMQAARNQQVLSTEQEEFLDGLSIVGLDYIDSVRAVQAEIETWIDEHPGQAPDIGDAVWPPLPTAEE